jgi:YihY family inner membrane protein
MATKTKEQHAEHAQDGHAQGEQTQHRTSTGAVVTVEKDAKPILALFSKFNNDWSMNLAAGLAYNLLMSIFPIIIAVLGILGLIIGHLSASAYAHLEQQLGNALAGSGISSKQLIVAALTSLNKSAGWLVLIAILLAVFSGSRLFVFIEGCFDIIYHVRPRTFIPQNIMAIGMLLLFVVLIPVMIVASSGPALVLSVLHIASGGFLVGLAGIIGSLIVGWILFEAILMVVPNQKISFRNSWLGALVAAVLLQIYLTLFPLFVKYTINNGPIATLGSFIILLVFFYYFAVILFLGAEVNAYFSEGIKATPNDIPTMVHQMTSHLPTSEKAMKEQAAASHKEEQPKVVLPKNEATTNVAKQVEEGKTPTVTGASNGTKAPATQVQDSSHPTHMDTDHSKKQKKQKSGADRTVTIVEAVAGTVLAFVVELVRLRRKK